MRLAARTLHSKPGILQCTTKNGKGDSVLFIHTCSEKAIVSMGSKPWQLIEPNMRKESVFGHTQGGCNSLSMLFDAYHIYEGVCNQGEIGHIMTIYVRFKKTHICRLKKDKSPSYI